MSKQFLAAALLSASAVLGLIPASASASEFTPDKNFPNDPQVRNLLEEALREYRIGRNDKAAAAFQAVAKLGPDPKTLFHWYLDVGDAVLVRMMEYDELDDVLKPLLRQARIYQKEMRRSTGYINTLIDKLKSETAGQEERVVATLELIAVGPIAVPHLVARIGDNRQDELRTAVRVVLTRMGYRAVVPLCEALRSKDARQVGNIAAILADIGDTRALPRLMMHAERADLDATTKQVITRAIAAIASKAGIEKLPAGEVAFLEEAQRYFRDSDAVRDEAVANEALMWRWNEDEQDAAKKLAYVRVPRYAWNELMAEQVLFDALGWKTGPTYLPLLAATLAAEAVETASHLRAAKERTEPARLPDDSPEAITERAQALSEQILRVRMFGGPTLASATGEAIAAKRDEVAAFLMRQLEDRWIARPDGNLPAQLPAPDKAGSILVTALADPSKTVRYQAAITLAHLDPVGVFPNGDKVVPVLAEAVGEWGARVVAVVDQDYRHRNSAREQLHKKGYVVATASDGFELKQRLAETPVKDAVIIPGDLRPMLRDEHGGIIDVPEQFPLGLVETLKKDPATAKTPVFISLPEDPALAAKVRAAFEGKCDGFIAKPFDAADLGGKLEIALKNAQLPNANREAAEDISLRACIALQKPDPRRTTYDLSVAADALIKTLDARSDAIRIEACKALGNIAEGRNSTSVRALANRVTDVYGAQDAQLKPEVRAAFLIAIGHLDPTSDPAVAIIAKALQHEDAGVRTAAAEAMGHALAASPELAARMQAQQRLDVRGPGAGKE